MRLPQDIANLLAVAVRDVVWYKDSVVALLRECDVPESVMLEVARMKRTTPTIKIVLYVLDELASRGKDGFKVAQNLLTKMHYWKDVHTIEEDRKERAIKSLKELQSAYQRYIAQQEYQRKQEQQMHEERVARTAIHNLDHARLQSFRDEFDEIHAIEDRQERGNRFQNLMNKIFDYYSEQSKGPFRRTGEQVDGLFYFDKHWYYVEIRWKEEQANAADVSVLRDRAKGAYGGDTKALFISFNGFTTECLESLKGAHDERVILMDGFDLRCILNCDIAFDVLLAEKQVDIVQKQCAFISAAEILKRRG